MNITIRDQLFELHPSQVLIWPSEKLLVVADIHLGKAHTFLQSGLWLTPEAHQSDLNLLKQAILSRDIEHILFLGDFVHSRAGVTTEVISEFFSWSQFFKGEISVIIGNHDRPLVSTWPKEWGFLNLIESIKIGQFTFQHEPPTQVDQTDFVWCGHIHPKVKLKRGADSLSLPAFVIEPNIGYLPAFTSLAAGMNYKGKKNSRFFVISGQQVLEVSR